MDFVEFHAPSNIFVFAFASGGGDFSQGVPPFEFVKMMHQLGVSYALFRDSTDRWYQNGVQGIGDRFAVSSYISRYALGLRSVCIGVSSGAYAALMYGQLAHVDELIAISPVTGVGDDVKGEFHPSWWHRVEQKPGDPPVPDLKPLFADGPKPKTIAFVSDGDGTELDRIMAERIGITDIRFIPGQTHGGLAKHMRDTGLLKDLILNGWGTVRVGQYIKDLPLTK